MSYVVTAQKPTSVSAAITGNFTSPTEKNLIISKSTRFEIHNQTPEGLQPFLDVGIYGRICSMHFFRPQEEEKDLLFIATEEHKFCVLAYDSNTGEIVTRSNGNISDRTGRPTENTQVAIIDPHNRMIILHLYVGILNVIPMNPHTGALSEAFSIRIDEIHVLDVKFLEGFEHPTIAVLHQMTDKNETRFVNTYTILQDEKDHRGDVWTRKKVESGASAIIPVPKPYNGYLVLGETSIIYVNGTKETALSMEASCIVAWGKVDPDGSRYLIGDLCGEIYVLLLNHNANAISGLKLEKLGTSACPSTLTYLDDGVIFAGSLRGDSHLIRLRTEPNEQTGSFLELLDSFTGLGPIVDFVVVDLERQGQGQVVTCSGAFKDGSLRIIRNGIGINEQATIELPGVKGVWSLSEDNTFDKYLVVSFVGQTRILAITDEVMDEISFPGLDATSQTLWCSNIVNNRIVQITEKEVRVISTSDFKLQSSWSSPDDSHINIATSNQSQIILSLGGGKLVYLDVEDSLNELATVTMEHEVSCLDIHPFGTDTRSKFCAIGLWTDISVRVLSLPDLKEINKEILGGEFLPRSVLLTTFEHGDYLLCALGDGHLFSFQFAQDTHALHDRKKVSLGTKPILLNSFRSNDATNVFAASDRPTVIYSNSKKLLFSNVNLKEVDYMCSFNAQAFPESLAIIGEDNLTIGTIDGIQKLHIRTIPLGEMPRRITHHEVSHSFAVLTVNATNEKEEGFLRIMDDQTFELNDSFQFNENESGSSIDTLLISENEQYVIVGTVIPEPGDAQVYKGRIIVFSIDSHSRKLNLLAEKTLEGGIFSLKSYDGKLIAGINGTVSLFEFKESAIEELASCAGNILALHLATRGNICAVGDLMRSVSVLHWNEGVKEFKEIARDYSPNWMTALEVMDDDTFVGAESFFNIFSVSKNSSSESEEERSQLECSGEFHLGESVNKFRHGSLVMKSQEPDAKQITTVLFATVSGAIGVIANLSETEFQFFEQVQRNINNVIKGVGGFEHSDWRSFKNDKRVRPSKGFIDGDLVESFLDLSTHKKREVVEGLSVSVEELVKRIEDLSQALH